MKINLVTETFAEDTAKSHLSRSYSYSTIGIFLLDINYRLVINDESSLAFNQTFFLTPINQPLILDTTKYINASKPLFTKGFESSIRYRWDELNIFLGYTFVDAQRQYYNSQTYLPLTPKHKVVLTAVYAPLDGRVFNVAVRIKL